MGASKKGITQAPKTNLQSPGSHERKMTGGMGKVPASRPLACSTRGCPLRPPLVRLGAHVRNQLRCKEESKEEQGRSHKEAKECGQLVGAEKGRQSPAEPPGRTQSCQRLDLRPSDLQDSRITHLCWIEALRVWLSGDSSNREQIQLGAGFWPHFSGKYSEAQCDQVTGAQLHSQGLEPELRGSSRPLGRKKRERPGSLLVWQGLASPNFSQDLLEDRLQVA